jgi:hypothetical protein
MPAPDPVAIPTGIATGHALLYTLTMPDGRKVSVYGNPKTWRQSAAKLLLDARRTAVPAVPQLAQFQPLPQE